MSKAPENLYIAKFCKNSKYLKMLFMVKRKNFKKKKFKEKFQNIRKRISKQKKYQKIILNLLKNQKHI